MSTALNQTWFKVVETKPQAGIYTKFKTWLLALGISKWVLSFEIERLMLVFLRHPNEIVQRDLWSPMSNDGFTLRRKSMVKQSWTLVHRRRSWYCIISASFLPLVCRIFEIESALVFGFISIGCLPARSRFERVNESLLADYVIVVEIFFPSSLCMYQTL